MRRWPSASRCVVASRAAALVVDHDGVARDSASRRSTSTTAIPGASRKPVGAAPTGVMITPGARIARKVRAAASLLVALAVVADEHHLVVGLAQHLLDAGREPRVELVAEVETTTPTTRLVRCFSVRADAFGT